MALELILCCPCPCPSCACVSSYSTIGGGGNHLADGAYCTIGGGEANTVLEGFVCCFVWTLVLWCWCAVWVVALVFGEHMVCLLLWQLAVATAPVDLHTYALFVALRANCNGFRAHSALSVSVLCLHV